MPPEDSLYLFSAPFYYGFTNSRLQVRKIKKSASKSVVTICLKQTMWTFVFSLDYLISCIGCNSCVVLYCWNLLGKVSTKQTLQLDRQPIINWFIHRDSTTFFELPFWSTDPLVSNEKCCPPKLSQNFRRNLKMSYLFNEKCCPPKLSQNFRRNLKMSYLFSWWISSDTLITTFFFLIGIVQTEPWNECH